MIINTHSLIQKANTMVNNQRTNQFELMPTTPMMKVSFTYLNKLFYFNANLQFHLLKQIGARFHFHLLKNLALMVFVKSQRYNTEYL
jgi:hypothetical protein